MAAAGAHGVASTKGRPRLARVLAVASLVGSVGIIVLAAALPST
ncbi:hypothetical protein ACQP25_24050 [Microtetraspora malaysiensis]